jgi:hypothetical protein
MFKINSRNPNNNLAAPGTSVIAERPATGNHQGLKARMLATVWMQATTVTPATSNIKDDAIS